MMMRVEAEGADIDALDATHIAAEYLRASETQRRTLLAGLLDAAGIVKVGGGRPTKIHRPATGG